MKRKKKVISGYFRGVPLCPLYGFGGILLVISFEFFSPFPSWFVIMATTFIIIFVEYIGGYFVEHFLGEKLWDYRDEACNLHGYISAYHSFLWLMLVSFIYVFWGNWLIAVTQNLNNSLAVSSQLDALIFFAVVVIGLYLTLHNKRRRLKHLNH